MIIPEDTSDDLLRYIREIERGLEESIKLQAHYAKLLNMHDGGKRTIFETVDSWILRLIETSGPIKL